MLAPSREVLVARGREELAEDGIDRLRLVPGGVLSADFEAADEDWRDVVFGEQGGDGCEGERADVWREGLKCVLVYAFWKVFF